MKKLRVILSVLLAAALGAGPLCAFGQEEAGKEPIWGVYQTDIVAYINNYPIPSVNVDGRMGVFCANLAGYGFDVLFDRAQNTIKITRNGQTEVTPIQNVVKSAENLGKKMGGAAAFDGIVTINGKSVPAFFYHGRPGVFLSDFKDAAKVVFDGEKRTVRLMVQGLSEGAFFELSENSAWRAMELTVAGYRKFNDDPLNYEFAAGAEKFCDDYGAEVEFIVGGGDGMGDDLIASIVAGTPWDLQYVFGVVVFPTALENGLFTPLDGYFNPHDERLSKKALEGASWRGHNYGISNLWMQEFSYSAYNETWFRELGIKTPHERYDEGSWTLDGFMEMVREVKEKGAEYSVNRYRVNVMGRYMTKWNADATAEITYNSPESLSWLSLWQKMYADPAYQASSLVGLGTAAGREVMYKDEVFPSVLKNEIIADWNGTDEIRYIQFPQNGNAPGTYLNDAHFMVPIGVKEARIPAAVELASYMCDERAAICRDVYQRNMTAEDFSLLEQNLDNAYYIPRFVSPTLWQDMLNQYFVPDMENGLSAGEHAAHALPFLQGKAQAWNEMIRSK